MLMLPAGVDVKKLKVKVAVDNIIMVIMRDQVMTLVVDQAMVQVLAQVPEDSSTKSKRSFNKDSEDQEIFRDSEDQVIDHELTYFD